MTRSLLRGTPWQETPGSGSTELLQSTQLGQETLLSTREELLLAGEEGSLEAAGGTTGEAAAGTDRKEEEKEGVDELLGGERQMENQFMQNRTQTETVIYVLTLLVSELLLYECYVTMNVIFTFVLWPSLYVVI